MTKLNDEISTCAANALVKLGIGASIGVGLSLMLYKRRPVWPIAGGAGFGLGMAYAECYQYFNNY